MSVNKDFENKLYFLSIIQYLGYKPSSHGCWVLKDKCVRLYDKHFERVDGEEVSYEQRVNQFKEENNL